MSGSSRLEKAHALSTAKNVKKSRVGGVMLKDNTLEDRMLKNRLTTLDRQMRRYQMHLDQAKKQFINLRVLPEPTIIVKRPRTPGHYLGVGEDGKPITDKSDIKHYMKPKDKDEKFPSSLITFDAFVCRRPKKSNIWHEVLRDFNRPVFTNTIVPCKPLSANEAHDLEVSWLYHTPNQTKETKERQATLTEEYKTVVQRRKSQIAFKSATVPTEELAPTEDAEEQAPRPPVRQSTFVTQLNDEPDDEEEEIETRESKKVRTSPSRKKVKFRAISAPKKKTMII